MRCGGKSALEAPSPKETSLLLVKMMAHVEKRFPEDRELNAQFLELVIQVYRFVAVLTVKSKLVLCFFHFISLIKFFFLSFFMTVMII